MTKDDPQHSIESVKIEADTVRVVCICGWTSAPHPTEEEAKAEFDTHQERP